MSLDITTKNGLGLKQAYDQDGYICVDPLFDAAKMAEINAELQRFIRDVVPKMPDANVYFEDKSDHTSLKQLVGMFEFDPYFEHLMLDSPIRQIAEEVLQENVVPINMQFFNKPAGIGQPTPPHQDGYYFHLTPCRAVTGWLALEPVDAENGCIHYLRGSHQTIDFRPHGRTGTLGFSQGITDFGSDADKADTVSFPGGPGTFLMHDAMTVHWAGANISQTRSRRALGFIYYAQSAKLDMTKKEAYQKQLDKELRDAGKI